MKYDVVGFGDHEFESGSSQLVPFLGNLTCPAVSCNIAASKSPLAQFYKPYVTFKFKTGVNKNIEQVTTLYWSKTVFKFYIFWNILQ